MGVINRSLGRSPEVAADLLLASAPFAVAATPPLKVAIIAGPGGPTTIDHFRAGAEPAAAVGKTLTPNVIRSYRPNATWPAVRAAVTGASVVVYLDRATARPSSLALPL